MQLEFEPVPVSTHSRPKAAGPCTAVMWTCWMFQLTAARRRLAEGWYGKNGSKWFQLTAARRRLATRPILNVTLDSFNSQPPEGGWLGNAVAWCNDHVSTHSRPKAAGKHSGTSTSQKNSFNSQPPEGGWVIARLHRTGIVVSTHSRPKAAGITASNSKPRNMFQLTAARRRLDPIGGLLRLQVSVSTHSRPKAAGPVARDLLQFLDVSTHSRPKAAGFSLGGGAGFFFVSTHSRPKAAGQTIRIIRLWMQFQLTAARRRLGLRTESQYLLTCFNSQPPEGGWFC